MGPASSAISVASVASILQTCLDGYRVLNVALATSDSSLTLNVRFRLEECRLYLWGRNWGLIQQMHEVTDIKACRESQPKETKNLDEIDALLEIAGLRNLVLDILARIDDALQKWNRIMKRYTNQTIQPQPSVASSIKDAGKQQKDQIKEANHVIGLTTKLRWAMMDKATLDELLKTLNELNNGLENLLPRTEKDIIRRGVVGEYLSTVGDLNESTSNDAIALDTEETKASRILSIREHNRTEDAEVSSNLHSSHAKGHRRVTHSERGRLDNNSPSQCGLPAKDSKDMPDSWEIPLEDFQHLTEPQLDYHHVRTKRPDTRGPENYVPLPRSYCLFHQQKDPHSASGTTVVDSEPESFRASPVVVLIEWRLQRAETSRSELSDLELRARREHVVSLLHQTAVADEDFKVLDCIGYTLSAGYTPDGERLPLVGFVYKYPSFASTKALPTTLRSMLDEAYQAQGCNVPSLEKRLHLSKALTAALYQLQCAGWIHRKISSYNILFFPDQTTGEIHVARPYLSGWQYSRPDDQMFEAPSEYSGRGIGDLDMYVHPARLVSRSSKTEFPRFRRSYDIYSLGVVLLEIAFWEPIIVLGSEEDRKNMQGFGASDSGRRSRAWQKTYINITKQEMAAEMGSIYRNVVLRCLQSLKTSDTTEWYHHPVAFEEPGIEKEFFWQVVQPLEKLNF